MLLRLLQCALVAVVTASAIKGKAAVYEHDFFASQALPTQIHIALADRTLESANEHGDGDLKRVGMTVSWATAMRTKSSIVRFAQNAANLSMEAHANVPCEQYDFCHYSSPWFHHVVIDGDKLLSDTTYYCECIFV